MMPTLIFTKALASSMIISIYYVGSIRSDVTN